MANNLIYDSHTQTIIAQQPRKLIDADTGEVIEAQQIIKRVYGKKAFWKCYLMDFLLVLGVLDSKQVDVFIYIVENTNPTNNLFIGTYKSISEDISVSQPTIAKIMRKLQDVNFIRRVQNGVYFLNPNILMKGDDKKKQIMLGYYESDTPVHQASRKRKKPALPAKQAPADDEQVPGQMSISDWEDERNATTETDTD